jgi:hypothetical protein
VIAVPATVTTPSRCGPAFDATVTVSPPGPTPVAAETTIQLTLLSAFQPQPPGPETVAVMEPPAAATDEFETSTLNWHGEPPCWTRARWPFTLIVPSRAVPAGFCATEN